MARLGKRERAAKRARLHVLAKEAECVAKHPGRMKSTMDWDDRVIIDGPKRKPVSGGLPSLGKRHS